MKWIAAVLVVVGCQHGPTVSAEYRADIANLCDAVKLSGADKVADDGRIAIIAMWLGPNIHTQEGHDFLVAIQPLQGNDKAKRLDDEAHRVGLDSCALSAEWRK
jgi:hypothetical protein